MRIEDSIQKFADFLGELSVKFSYKQKVYAKNMLEDILSSLNRIEIKNEAMAAELTGLTNANYPDILLKLVDLLILTGYDFIDIDFMDRETIEFMIKNRDCIVKSGDVTANRIQYIAGLIKYCRQTTGKFPESMNEVIISYNDLKKLKNEPAK